jgi:SAM-dependent methyltransferase
VGFDVSADAYGRFMGRFSEPLAPKFVDQVGATAGQRALDVGCGPGALTAPLVDRLGADHVSAIDPSQSFVAALYDRLPGVHVRVAAAEALPFDDDTFDLAIAQLVVHFMKDPVAGIAEMARVTRPGGIVAANVWDHARGNGPVSMFWNAVHTIDPIEEAESTMPGVREGHLAELFSQAGLTPEQTTLSVEAHFESFDDWWVPYTMGVGPAGEYVKKLDDEQRDQLRDAAARLLPAGPFDLPAQAWCVSALV